MMEKGISRENAIIRTSLAGIVVNVFLAAFKLTVGIASNSVSIIADAINNLADMMSSVITIIGTRFSEKEPDRRHPFGYGRSEYISSLIIGIVILYAGLEAFKSSVERILHPEANDYSTATLVVISAAVVVKILIGLYTKKRGQRLQSQALIASGAESLADAVMSAATVLAAAVLLLTGYNIEAWVGAVISLFIIKPGIETIREASSKILGEGADLKLASAVRNSILSFPEIEGVYGLVIHSYGSGRLMGSAYVELSDRYTVAWVDNLQRAVTARVKNDTGVTMLGLSMCAINTHSEDAIQAREKVRRLVEETEGAVQLHGFYIDRVDKTINFAVSKEFGVRSRESVYNELYQKVCSAFPEYSIKITVEHDLTE